MRRTIGMLAIAASLTVAGCAKKATVDDVVKKIVQAYGGAEKMAAIQDQVSTWDSKMVVMMGDSSMTMSGVMTITYKRPNKIKFETKDPDGNVGYLTIFDGTNGWVYMMGETGPSWRDMSPAEIQETTTLAETWLDGWHGYAAKGLKLAMLSDTTMNGKAHHRIQVTDRFGNASMNYCDAQTGLCERTEAETTDPMTMAKMPNVMTFTDYTAHDGWMMPQKVANYDAKGNLMFEVALKDCKNNAGVADDAFAKPAPPAEHPTEHPAEKK
jgi:outer membrane lipoprotein-sorting protein